MISRRWHRWTRTKLNPARNRCAPGRPTVERLEERALLSSGAALDPTFGAAGLTLTDFGGVAFADAVAVQPDGKVLAAGGVRIDTGGFQIALARYNPDGALDAGFGSGGKVTAGPAHSARALAVQPDGKIVVAAGDAGPGSLARYNPDGSLDGTFGTGGTAPLGWGGHILELPDGVTLQPDGKILVSGFMEPFLSMHQPTPLIVARYNPDGTPDAGFGTGGVVTGRDGAAYQVLPQPDGSLLVAETVNGAFTVARLSATGVPDAGFGTGGQAPVDFGAGGAAVALAVQPDGRIVAAGTAGRDLALARFSAAGQPDPSFGLDGKVVTNFGPAAAQGLAMTLTPGGRIEVVGSGATEGPGSPARFVVFAGYRPDGSLDSRLGAGGTAVVSAQGPDVRAATFQPDGKPVVVGPFTNSSTTSLFAAARVVVAAVPVTGTPAERFVGQLYLDVLGRTAAAAEQASWAGMLDRGELTRDQAAWAIENSPEGRTRVVQDLYGRLLYRTADPTGLNGSLAFLAGGGTAEQLEAILIGSPEYYANRGANTADGFVQAVYHDVLGRTPSVADAAAWTQAMSQGVSPQAVAAAFLTSPESDRDETIGLYHRFLGRAPDAGGYEAVFQALQHGAANELAAAVLAGSAEYFADAQA